MRESIKLEPHDVEEQPYQYSCQEAREEMDLPATHTAVIEGKVYTGTLPYLLQLERLIELQHSKQTIFCILLHKKFIVVICFTFSFGFARWTSFL